jgi:hypothetical protein
MPGGTVDMPQRMLYWHSGSEARVARNGLWVNSIPMPAWQFRFEIA